MDELLYRGIQLFNQGEFFECHEVLEELWTPQRGPRRLFLQAIIHIAVAFHHCQRSNTVGAAGQLRKALRKLPPYLPTCESIDTARLYADALAAAELLRTGATPDTFPRIHLLQ